MSPSLHVHVVSIALFGLATVGVGGVLLRRALSVGKTPDLALSIALLLQAFGWAAALGVLVLVPTPGPKQNLLLHAADLASVVGHVALLYFVRAVFRPKSRVAGVAMWSAGGALACIPFINATFASDDLTTPLYWPEYALKTFGFVWASIEAFRYHGRMRRRVRYGIADPVVSNRLFLWGFVTAGTAFAETAITCLFAWPEASWTAPLGDVATLLGVPLALALVLAFHPPLWYVRLLAMRASVAP